MWYKIQQTKRILPVSYSILYKGVGYLPICRDCVDTIYNTYFEVCHDQEAAVRQVCRKLDLYWSKPLYEQVTRKSTPRSIMTQYLAKLAGISHSGKSYDDTLLEEGSMWTFLEWTSKMCLFLLRIQMTMMQNVSLTK